MPSKMNVASIVTRRVRINHDGKFTATPLQALQIVIPPTRIIRCKQIQQNMFVRLFFSYADLAHQNEEAICPLYKI